MVKTSSKSSPRRQSLNKSIRALIAQHLWLKILIGMGLGIALGLTLSPAGLALVPESLAQDIGSWVALPGRIFLGLIQMVIVPLIICSIILGITTSGSLEFLKTMGLRIVPYFVFTTALSISIGLIVVNVIKPGSFIDAGFVETAMSSGQGHVPAKTFEDLTIPERIANLIPTNFTQASLDRDMLKIVIGSIILGIVMLSLKQAITKPFNDLCVFGQIATMRIISWAMVIAPYAVFGLICEIVIKIGFDALAGVGMYFISVLAGLLLMLCAYLLIISLIGGRNPITFLKSIREVQLLAFSTSSSAAVMPLSIQAAEEKLKVRPEIARFVVPLGATINMDGTALYQGVAAIFLCQIFGVDLSAGETAILLLTTIGASIGTPATPGVGIIVLATILIGIGVPPEGIGIILGVDRILDMCRTTINVTGDLTATAVMERWMKKK